MVVYLWICSRVVIEGIVEDGGFWIHSVYNFDSDLRDLHYDAFFFFFSLLVCSKTHVVVVLGNSVLA